MQRRQEGGRGESCASADFPFTSCGDIPVPLQAEGISKVVCPGPPGNDRNRIQTQLFYAKLWSQCHGCRLKSFQELTRILDESGGNEGGGKSLILPGEAAPSSLDWTFPLSCSEAILFTLDGQP